MNFAEIDEKVKQFTFYKTRDHDKAEEIRAELRAANIMLTNEIYGTGWKGIDLSAPANAR